MSIVRLTDMARTLHCPYASNSICMSYMVHGTYLLKPECLTIRYNYRKTRHISIVEIRSDGYNSYPFITLTSLAYCHSFVSSQTFSTQFRIVLLRLFLCLDIRLPAGYITPVGNINVDECLRNYYH